MNNILGAMNKQFIKNVKLPVCKKCCFFILQKSGRNQNEVAICQKFGEKNIISGEIKYELAHFCRNDTNLCGEAGIYFEKTI